MAYHTINPRNQEIIREPTTYILTPPLNNFPPGFKPLNSQYWETANGKILYCLYDEPDFVQEESNSPEESEVIARRRKVAIEQLCSIVYPFNYHRIGQATFRYWEPTRFYMYDRVEELHALANDQLAPVPIANALGEITFRPSHFVIRPRSRASMAFERMYHLEIYAEAIMDKKELTKAEWQKVMFAIKEWLLSEHWACYRAPHPGVNQAINLRLYPNARNFNKLLHLYVHPTKGLGYDFLEFGDLFKEVLEQRRWSWTPHVTIETQYNRITGDAFKHLVIAEYEAPQLPRIFPSHRVLPLVEENSMQRDLIFDLEEQNVAPYGIENVIIMVPDEEDDLLDLVGGGVAQEGQDFLSESEWDSRSYRGSEYGEIAEGTLIQNVSYNSEILANEEEYMASRIEEREDSVLASEECLRDFANHPLVEPQRKRKIAKLRRTPHPPNVRPLTAHDKLMILYLVHVDFEKKLLVQYKGNPNTPSVVLGPLTEADKATLEEIDADLEAHFQPSMTPAEYIIERSRARRLKQEKKETQPK